MNADVSVIVTGSICSLNVALGATDTITELALLTGAALAACGDAGLTEGAEGGDVTVSNHPSLLFSPP